MLEHLFGSKTRYRMLRLFFREPEKFFFVRELTRELDTQINAVRRELSTLQDTGIVEEVEREQIKKGPKKKFYRLNRACLLYPELQALLLKENILSEQAFVDRIAKKGGDIQLLVLSGCFTSDMRAPTDMLVVGNIKETTVSRAIAEYEKEFSAPIRYTFLTEAEFHDRRQIMDKFLFGIFEAEHMKMINELGV